MENNLYRNLEFPADHVDGVRYVKRSPSDLPIGKSEEPKIIFVFGSNLAGIHGAGAALSARRHHGAILGQGKGIQGNSYAIPTKDTRLATLPLSFLRRYVREFLGYAVAHPELTFAVTRIGCGLAGYTDEQISPMFENAPSNVVLPKQWGGEGFDF